MAKTKSTINARDLTEQDKSILKLCEKISEALKLLIPDETMKTQFWNDYGKISYTRDAGLGRGGGKLQRDALTTRGDNTATPVSNRNFRWTPLVLCDVSVDYAENIDSLSVIGEELYININNNGTIESYKFSDCYHLPKRYCITSKNWEHVADVVSRWNTDQWKINSSCIRSYESCDWFSAVEVFAVLGIAVASELYKADFNKCYSEVTDILEKQDVDKTIVLPSEDFPTDRTSIISDPLIKLPIHTDLSNLLFSDLGPKWKPSWSSKSMASPSELQIMHIDPLVEKEIRHKASNVRYGFRWTNVAMGDHTIDETLALMETIIYNNSEDKE